MSTPDDNKLQTLRDRRHDLLAQAAGVGIEIAMELGDRPAACEALVRMHAAIAARRALRGLDLGGGQ
jgi:hypothetical protein